MEDTTMRALEEGWELLSAHDPNGRRGVWMRSTPRNTDTPTSIELCAGREGDDAYVKIELHETMTAKKLYEILDVLAWGVTQVEHCRVNYPNKISKLFFERPRIG